MPIRVLDPAEWESFFARVTSEHPAFVSIAFLPAGSSPVVEARDLPFRAARVESREAGRTIAVEVEPDGPYGPQPPRAVRYTVPEPATLLWWSRDGEDLVEILGRHDALTLLRFRARAA